MKILLVQPDRGGKMVGFGDLIRPEPLVLEILAASVPDHEVKVLDLRLGVGPGLEETLRDFQPQLVGVTGYTTDVPRMLIICQKVKALDPSITTVCGGYHASLVPEDFNRDFVDVVVVGEGEATFPELVQALEDGGDLGSVVGIYYRKDGRQVLTGMRELLADLDNTPFPTRHLTDHYRDHYHFHFWTRPYLVETARGCPYRCTFCAVWKFHRRLCRTRTPERVLAEMKTFSSEIVCFVDDNFLQNLRRSERLYRLIKNEGIQTKYWCQARADSIVRRPDIIEKWASIGLSTILIGFEKFREEELASVNKNSSVRTNEEAMRVMRDNGVDMWGAFIVDPQWTRSDFDALIDYVRSMKIVFPQFTILTPLPGTDFFYEKVDELITSNYEIFDFLHTVLPTRLPIEEFYANMARLYSSTLMSLSDLRQRIRSGRIPAHSLTRVKGLLADVTDPEAYLRSMGELRLTPNPPAAVRQ